MSLEFNRRSFLKYSAAAAVVVAGSSLLTGCGDEYTKTGTIGSRLTLLGKHKLESASAASSASAYNIECNLTHECTDKDAPLCLNNGCYELTVYKKGEKTTYTDYTTDNMTLTASTLSPKYEKTYDEKTYELKKDDGEQNFTLNITDVALEDGDYVDLKYWPNKVPNAGQDAFTRVYCIWKMQATKNSTGMTLVKR